MLRVAKGTASFGKRHNKTHILCRRCGSFCSPPAQSTPPALRIETTWNDYCVRKETLVDMQY
ncbi:hypothetical protein IMZ48_42530 [Candidatus Bathyarchaeota archaeon]|nr:hypothetical protein [Candidatus Bathyarchaeota archaeon]